MLSTWLNYTQISEYMVELNQWGFDYCKKNKKNVCICLPKAEEIHFSIFSTS